MTGVENAALAAVDDPKTGIAADVPIAAVGEIDPVTLRHVDGGGFSKETATSDLEMQRDVQREASGDVSAPEASARFGPVGSAQVAVCRCGAGQHPERDDRCAAGHLLPGFAGPAVVTGEHSKTFWAAEDAARREIRSAVVRDAGYTEEDAPTALQLASESIAQATLVRDSAYRRVVEAGGPLSSAGKSRRAFSVWLLSIDRLERHLRLVGLRRSPKPTMSLAQVLADEESDS